MGVGVSGKWGRVLTASHEASILVPVLVLVSGPRPVPSPGWVSASSFVKSSPELLASAALL